MAPSITIPRQSGRFPGFRGLRKFSSKCVGRSSRPTGKLLCQANGGQHAGRIGDGSAGNVVSGPVVWRSADEWEPQSPVYAILERDHLQGSQTLIVIHGNDTIVVTSQGVMKQRIGRNRTVGVQLFAR